MTRTSWILFCKHYRTRSTVIIKDAACSHPVPLFVCCRLLFLPPLCLFYSSLSLLVKLTHTHTHLLTNAYIVNKVITEHCVPRLLICRHVYAHKLTRKHLFFQGSFLTPPPVFLPAVFPLCVSPPRRESEREREKEGGREGSGGSRIPRLPVHSAQPLHRLDNAIPVPPPPPPPPPTPPPPPPSLPPAPTPHPTPPSALGRCALQTRAHGKATQESYLLPRLIPGPACLPACLPSECVCVCVWVCVCVLVCVCPLHLPICNTVFLSLSLSVHLEVYSLPRIPDCLPDHVPLGSWPGHVQQSQSVLMCACRTAIFFFQQACLDPMTVCLSLCLYTSMHVFLYHCLSASVSSCMFPCLSSHCTCLAVSLSACLFSCPHLPACVSIYLPVTLLSVCLSFCLLPSLPGVCILHAVICLVFLLCPFLFSNKAFFSCLPHWSYINTLQLQRSFVRKTQYIKKPEST